jgi:hypothetical protein
MEGEQNLFSDSIIKFEENQTLRSSKGAQFLRSSITYGRNSTTSFITDENNLNSSNLSTPRGSFGFQPRGSRGAISRFSNEDDFNLENYQTNPGEELNLRGSTGYSNFRKSISFSEIDSAADISYVEPTPIVQTINSEKYKYIGYVSLEGKRDGFGVCYYKNGDKYTGMFKNDKKEGFGKFYIKSAGKTFKGEFKNNTIDGFVEYTNKNGVTHYGVMKNFKFVNKEAMIIDHPKYEFEGIMEFNVQSQKLCGLAKIKYKNGNCYEGETIENCEHGWGITKRNDQHIIQGEKSDNKYNGYCEIQYPNGTIYFGWWSNSKQNGLGITISAKGEYTIGKYLEDIKNGGFLTCCNGATKFELYHFGFLSKTIEQKDVILNYTNLVYPEYRWLCKTNNKVLAEMLCKVFGDE